MLNSGIDESGGILVPISPRTCHTDLHSDSASFESGPPCLRPDFSGTTLSFLPLRLILAIDFMYAAFNVLSNVFLYS